MHHAIKTVLNHPSAAFPRSLSSNLGRETSTLRFCTKSDKMDKAQKPSEETTQGDVMSDSFGEGYGTRSDEEGFGGIYGGNQSTKTETDKPIHENHPGYDKSQGSEVREKEKARHQPSAKS